jgi:AraC-like DNA-binding protein
MERRFLAGVGIGPKRFARILRFQRALREKTDDARAWADVALDCGYCDQAHFIRDFKSFTGTSPARFFAEESPLTRFFTRSRRASDSYKTRAALPS